MLRVTHVLKLVGLVDDAWFSDRAARRGTAVHLATELDDAGELDESSVDPAVAPYLESWRRFRRESGLEVADAELEVRHEALGYAGRIDRVVRWPGSDRACVLDLKAGQPQPWHQLQLAAYALAYRSDRGGPTPARAAVYLRPDGKSASMREFKDRADFDAWKAAVCLAHWIGRNGGSHASSHDHAA